jgi:hypothetical protein
MYLAVPALRKRWPIFNESKAKLTRCDTERMVISMIFLNHIRVYLPFQDALHCSHRRILQKYAIYELRARMQAKKASHPESAEQRENSNFNHENKQIAHQDVRIR